VKRLVFLIAAVAALLCGCTSDGSMVGAQEAGDTAIVWWTTGTVPADFDLGMARINGYLAEKGLPPLDLQIRSYGEHLARLDAAIASGEYLDLAYTDASDYNKLVSLGAFRDITDEVRAVAPELWRFVPETLWLGATAGGKIYAVPTYKDSSLATYWAFDEEYTDKYGVIVSDITDMAGLDAAMRLMKAGEGEDFYPLQFGVNSNFVGFFDGYDSFSSAISAIGVRLDDESREVVYTLEQPDVLERLAYVRRWYLDGIINPDADKIPDNHDRKPAVVISVAWPGAESLWQRRFGVNKYTMTRVFGPVYTTETVQGSMTAVWANSRRAADALKLLELVNTDHKLRDMFAYGIEGRNFEYVGDNVVRILDGGWSVEVFSQGTFFTMSQTTEGPPDQWEMLKELNEQARSSVIMGFMLDIGDIALEVSRCQAVWSKYEPQFRTGTADLDTAVAACMEELRQNGIETIVSEAQKQIDAFHTIPR
jgi:putative aldouronate transport system substrate-binding protein